MKNSTLDPKRLELIKIRVPQINGCAFCLNRHTEDARKMGESERRIYLLNAWRDTAIYSGEEKASLVFSEALTQIATNPVSDEAFGKMKTFFLKEKSLIWSLL